MTPTELKAIAEKLHYAIRPNESQCYALLNYITALEARVQAAEGDENVTESCRNVTRIGD